MLNKFCRCITAFLLVAVMSVIPNTGVYAEAQEDEVYDEIFNAANSLYESLMLVSDYYMGGDITVEELYNAAMRGVSEILDPYSEFMTDEEFEAFAGSLSNNEYGIGVYLDEGDDGYPVVAGLVNGMPAKECGILVGDKIKAVNGEDMRYQTIDIVRSNIVGSGGGSVKLRILRTLKDGEETELDITIKRAKIDNTSVFVMTNTELKKYLSINNMPSNIGYIAITSVNDDTASEFEKAVKKLLNGKVTKLILDLRNNTGGFLDQAVEICNLIVPEGPVIHMKSKDGTKITEYSTLKKCPFEKIAVVVNGYTASAAEIIASALQDSKAGIIIGQTTFGKGIVQSTFGLTYGGVIKLTTEEYFSRNNKKINNIGVIPNVTVEHLSVNEITDSADKSGADILILEKALNLLGFSDIKPDKILDSKTEDALGEYQKAHELEETHTLDTETAYAINVSLQMYYDEFDVDLLTAYERLIK